MKPYLSIKTIINPDTGRTLEYVDKKPCVIAMVVNKANDSVLMVNQFRAGVADYIHEFPGGVIEDSQTPTEALFAELSQEVGIEKSDISMVMEVGHYLTSVGWTNEDTYLYHVQLREDFYHKEQQLDEEESLTYSWIPIDKIHELFDGAIPMKTSLLIEHFNRLYGACQHR